MHRLTLILGLSLLLLGCGAPGPSLPAASTPAPTYEVLAILTAPQPPQACMEALATGTLVLSPISGLGLGDPNGGVTPVEWPFGYRAIVVDGQVVLLDDHGEAVARAGQTIQMGGGFGRNMWHTCGPIEVVPG